MFLITLMIGLLIPTKNIFKLKFYAYLLYYHNIEQNTFITDINFMEVYMYTIHLIKYYMKYYEFVYTAGKNHNLNL